MKLNKVIAVIFLLTFIGYSLAQVDTAWVRRYNGSGDGADVAKALAVDNSGNVYVAGSIVGDTTGLDWTVIKYNSNGDSVWVRNFISPGNKNEEANALAVGNSGNIYVTGYAMGSDSFDFLTIKYSPTGETLWTRRLNNINENGIDFAVAITLDGSENVYVTGCTEGAAGADYDYFTVKYNSSGVFQWARIYNSGLNRRDVPKAIKVDGLGNVYVTGSSNTSFNDYDYTTKKYGPNGEEGWAMPYNGPANGADIANAMAIDDSGYIYVTGASTGFSFDYATIKYTPIGETVWVRRYNGPVYGEDGATAIAVDGSGNIYVTGASTDPDSDYVTIKYNPAGETLWVRRYDVPSGYGNGATAIAVDGPGNVYVTGRSVGIGTNYDFATIKYNQPGYTVRDVGTSAILSPPYVVALNDTVVPACSVYNYGDTTETYLVRMKIGSIYEDTVRVNTHLPGTSQYLTFDTLIANQPSMYPVSCSTELLVDGIKRNDKLTSSVVVGTVDVELFRILAPTGTVDTLPVVPRARIRNNSSVTLDIPVTFKIFKGSMVYSDSRIVNLSGNHAMYDVPFDTFYIHGADTGNYTTEAAVSVLGDQDTSNDTKTGAFTVAIFAGGPSWQAMAPIPPGLSLKQPKAGSCITELRNKLYFLKASNTQDFLIFTPDAGIGTWTSDTIPIGSKLYGDGKRPKKGAAITAYQQERSIYILRGANTVGFWKYQADSTGGRTIGWTKMRNIPEGLKKPKECSGMATFRQHGDGFIFTMKGSNTDEFYIYSIVGDTWHKVSSPPPGQSGKVGYKKGSCLTYDGDFMYVLKGNYGDFFKYSVDGDTWHQLRRYDYRTFLNRDGKKKKVKDGASLVFYDDNIYLLKGGNTLEFWRYEIASDSWIQMNPGATWDILLGGGKRVKAGGCMTMDGSSFYVVKGGNTNEFYRHDLPVTTLASVQPTTDGIQADKSLRQGFSLKITPNPAIKVMSVRYNLPAAKPVNLKLYNISGALVKTYTNPNPIKNGVWAIDAKSLPAGVYVVRFVSGEINAKCKIIIQK